MSKDNVTTSRLTPKLALALDMGDLSSARDLAHKVRDVFPIVKVGLELFTAEGPKAITAFRDDGFAVFCDLKLHDIPTTVSRAASVVGRLGASYLTVHTAGGGEMVRAGVEGLTEGAAQLDLTSPPIVLGVTVLTSEAGVDPGVVITRARLARDFGCGGIVCAAPDLSFVRSEIPGLVTVVPGTRPAGSDVNDQARVDTPERAIENGADILVIGRVVTAANDPVAAAIALATSIGL